MAGYTEELPQITSIQLVSTIPIEWLGACAPLIARCPLLHIRQRVVDMVNLSGSIEEELANVGY
jgi:hypothetical protein